MTSLQDIFQVILIGIGATAFMDLWLMLVKRMGVPTLNFALLGRWVGHLFQGRFAHPSISKAEPIQHEAAWGWITHYATGMAFAALLVIVQGAGWAAHPTPGPAIAVGACTVIAPLFVMQPAMGAGFASSRTPTPLKNCLRSLVNHTVFGLGLYLSATVIAALFAAMVRPA
ncbi:MAG TPA: DUF2938 domain-containing protein [Aquabacterium sp.]|uniref:DUF2938 domain-containing protein n=1 Tax=Aquabacterium sp. TaxID=1872578 RepID=UPI002E321574|nr:DUF2938 domain-containing protein [Aquabacterium sp.]HEX5358012.1 DUF2938 domain-containing protein [Aquabacterium sp.]